MDETRRAFLDDLLSTPSPSGFEADGQRVWVEYVRKYADEVRTDAYGNAVAAYEGGDEDSSEGEGASDDGPEIAFAGHADEIGYMVSGIDSDGFVRIAPIGGADRSVSKGQHVQVHTADGDVPGVIGQTAIHLREADDDEPEDIVKQHVDVGAGSAEEARDLVEVGDPITVTTGIQNLAGTRIASPGLDNRAGTWVAAEALRRAAERGVEATVYAVSTVQEEVGLKGAKMVGYDLDPDVVVAADVTHASDHPSFPRDRHNDIALGEGPVVARGTSNHPEVVRVIREAGEAEDIDLQFQAAGVGTGTDADAFYTERGGIPSLNVGIPNRYMHTPAEVVDTADLDTAADLLAAFADRTGDREGFAVQI